MSGGELFVRSPVIKMLVGTIVFIFAMGLFVFSQKQLARINRPSVAPELMVSMPLFAQVLLSGGDRYLAANINGFRVLVAETEKMDRNDYAVQAKLQRDIAWLNPGHEDNYYIAAAILPWNGELDASQYVLERASQARLHDWQPPFYLGFNYYYFLKDPATGAALLNDAAPRVKNQQNAWALQNVAARWLEKGYDTATAAHMVSGMANNAPPGAFRDYLQKRAERLEDLAFLQNLAVQYKEKYSKPPLALDDFVKSGLIDKLPVDPLGKGFQLDEKGIPVFIP